MWEYLPGTITWAPACNFPGNDIRNFTTVMPVTNKCQWWCQNTKGCTNFVWSDGTCSLKKGPITTANAVPADPNFVCGINTNVK